MTTDNRITQTQKISDLKEALKDVNISDNYEDKSEVGRIMSEVYIAMLEKGYNPANQIIGYIISGDPTYITSHKDARKKMTRVSQDELLEEIVNCYIKNNL